MNASSEPNSKVISIIDPLTPQEQHRLESAVKVLSTRRTNTGRRTHNFRNWELREAGLLALRSPIEDLKAQYQVANRPLMLRRILMVTCAVMIVGVVVLESFRSIVPNPNATHWRVIALLLTLAALVLMFNCTEFYIRGFETSRIPRLSLELHRLMRR